MRNVTPEELDRMKAAYLAMLRLSPVNPVRLHGQNVLVGLREGIAEATGLTSQTVQGVSEEYAIFLNATPTEAP